MSKIFNPLYANLEQQQTATASGDQVATAAIYNEVQGQCPKCKGKMTTGTLANADSVYFCETCRVTSPFTDA